MPELLLPKHELELEMSDDWVDGNTNSLLQLEAPLTVSPKQICFFDKIIFHVETSQ